ncbi:MAG: aminomethyl-transferring glycine dehydrogenase [Ancrocorticia sp.]|uniref:aminomethyl-transferring glycine dehydrogenase n=1 Tax=Ancrocorticia sp. TaxID=2593684 RepID=UPI003F92641A
MADFSIRHTGTRGKDRAHMLAAVHVHDLDTLMSRAMPHRIASPPADERLPRAATEAEVASELASMAAANTARTSMIGQGYYDTETPAVIRRGILENPSWYTAYTPYQPEISQGRLEALVNFQTMVSELTAMEIAGASLLDEPTAAAEAIALASRATGRDRIAVDRDVFEQTRAVIETRCRGLDIELVPVNIDGPMDLTECSGLLVQYPGATGRVHTASTYRGLGDAIHEAGGLFIMVADLLACSILTPPGELGADIVAGSAQRFGLPMGGGGPHAGYIACREKYKRNLPGRIVGVSKDSAGNPAYRLALQTREQHIRREKATSNICTAQSLLAIMASMYAVYHGPEGLAAMADRVHGQARALACNLADLGAHVNYTRFFDTLTVSVTQKADEILAALLEENVTAYRVDGDTLRLSADECTTDLARRHVVQAFARVLDGPRTSVDITQYSLGEDVRRTSQYMEQATFHRYRSETGMMRYMHRLAEKDYALDRGMIPLGSCTMKLNAAVEVSAITHEGFARIHPFAPAGDLAGYRTLISDLETWLAELTGYDAVSLQPNAGSQGEFAGLLAIRGYHEARGQGERRICLIPASAHGTNAASAVMAGFRVVVVKTAADGSIDLQDLDRKIEKAGAHIGAIMLTYPSTHGTFEEQVTEVTDRVHRAGGQVYIDGANLNALVGYARPGAFGGDVSHLNLHKTFAIPHGGGGPGVGPVAAKEHLAPYLPGFPAGAVSGAPWGSASILPITWAYITLLGYEGLREATASAVLAANYVAARLEPVLPVLYRGPGGFVGHECILDDRPLKEHYGVSVDDVAKRLIDYGFHAPTMSFPVPGTLMVEPTESESLEELDRFCDAMEAIAEEAAQVGDQWSADDNPLRLAPHTAHSLLTGTWEHPYSQEMAAYPDALAAKKKGRDPEYVHRLIESKYWAPVGRIDAPWGDRNLQCTCPPPEAFEEQD